MILGNISDELYFSRPELSNSDLSLIKESYSHYLDKARKVVTPAMIFGKAFDQYLLREKEFFENFFILPEGTDGRTTKGKELKEQARQSGREILSHQDWLDLNQMKGNVLDHPICANIIKESQNEGSYTGVIAGVEMRCKLDIFNRGYIVDIKTCQSAKKSDFEKDIANRDYHRQMAVYVEIVRQNIEGVNGAALIPVEKPTPSNFIPRNCGVNILKLTEDDLKLGLIEAEELIAKYKFHKEHPEIYTGYTNIQAMKELIANKENFLATIDTAELPSWRRNKIGEL